MASPPASGGVIGPPLLYCTGTEAGFHGMLVPPSRLAAHCPLVRGVVAVAGLSSSELDPLAQAGDSEIIAV
jgi:hypothetical protein